MAAIMNVLLEDIDSKMTLKELTTIKTFNAQHTVHQIICLWLVVQLFYVLDGWNMP